MAIFTKTIPPALIDEAIDAYCFAYKYQENIIVEGELIQNPESKIAFSKRMDREHTINLIKQYRMSVLEAERENIDNQTDIDCEPITVE